jgi:hypothetical protein
MEFEMGLADDLLTAFYLNWKTATVEEVVAGVPQGEAEHEFEFQGISSEWKLKLADPVADAVGFALYGEVGLGDHEAELEGKLILDKRMGNWLLAYNFVLEKEFEFEPGETEEETALENVLGIAHVFNERFSLGLEARQHAEFIPNDPAGDPEHIAWFAGPALSYAGANWWVAATCLFQLPAIQSSSADPGRNLVLDEHEEINVRVILSWEL